MSEVTVAGCGPGAVELIAPAVFEAAQKCDVLIGTERLLKRFEGPEKKLLKDNYPEILGWIAENRKKLSILVLVTGDPLIHSFGTMVVEQIGLEYCRIIPGISSIQYALAKVGRSWEGVKIISLHGKTCSNLAEQLRKFPDLAILTDGENTARVILDTISVMPLRRKNICLCENLSLETEKISLIRPEEEIPHKISPLHVILVLTKSVSF